MSLNTIHFDITYLINRTGIEGRIRRLDLTKLTSALVNDDRNVMTIETGQTDSAGEVYPTTIHSLTGRVAAKFASIFGKVSL